MKLPDIEVLNFVKTQLTGLIDLASSGMQPIMNLSDLGIDFSSIPLWGDNQYGYPVLKEILASHYRTQPDHIAVTPGASMGNFTVLSALLNDGDVTGVESPYYEPFHRLSTGLTNREPIHIIRRSVDGYCVKPDLELLNQHKPKVTILTNLHNPSGIFEKPETFIRMADLVGQWDGWIMIDEIFLPFLEDYRTETTAVSHDRIIVTSSLSKCWGLQGLRIGWIVGEPEQIRQMQLLINSFHVTQPFITEYIAARVLSNGNLVNSILNSTRQRANDNWALVKETLDKTHQLDYVTPSGGISVFAEFRDGRDSESFCEQLRREYKTLVIPGRFFGQPTGFRLCYGNETESLIAGLQAVSTALENT